MNKKKNNKNKSKQRNKKSGNGKKARNQQVAALNLGPMIKSAIASGLRTAGASVGGLFGPAGSAAGHMVGAGLSQIVGAGDYTINENTVLKGDIPKFLNGGRRIRLAHAEFLGDVTSSTAFSIFNSYVLNPGNAQTFPWLSQIAANFQQFKFHGLVFEFKSTSAVALNSTNVALGTVVLATQYNVNDAAFTTKVQMENYEFSTSAPPSTSQMHPVECSMAESPYNVLWIRSEDGSQTLDPIYDHGLFSLATVGMQAASTIGELWVTYDVELLKPRITAPRFSNVLWSYTSGSYTDALPLTSTGTVYEDDIDITITGTALRFSKYVQSGTFYILVSWEGATPVAVTFPVVSLTNCVAVTKFTAEAVSFLRAPAAGETASRVTYSTVISISGYSSAGSLFTLGAAGTLPGTPLALNVFVIKIA
jgi:hypothetical protein